MYEYKIKYFNIIFLQVFDEVNITNIIVASCCRIAYTIL